MHVLLHKLLTHRAAHSETRTAPRAHSHEQHVMVRVTDLPDLWMLKPFQGISLSVQCALKSFQQHWF